MQRELRDKGKLSKVKRLARTATEAKLYIQRHRKPRQNTMAVVCYIHPTVSSSGCVVGNKRLYSETEESSESEEDSVTMSRHCQAVWNRYEHMSTLTLESVYLTTLLCIHVHKHLSCLVTSYQWLMSRRKYHEWLMLTLLYFLICLVNKYLLLLTWI